MRNWKRLRQKCSKVKSNNTQAGGGAINSTHLLAFPEKTLQFSFSNTCVNIERGKRPSIAADIKENKFQPIYDAPKRNLLCQKSSECFEINTSLLFIEICYMACFTEV